MLLLSRLGSSPSTKAVFSSEFVNALFIDAIFPLHFLKIFYFILSAFDFVENLLLEKIR